MYLWNANTGDIEQLMECSEEDDYVTSVSWGADSKHVAVGTSSSAVQIWDANRVKQIRSLNGHAARVGALSWNNAILSSGGRDSIIINHDVRLGFCADREHATWHKHGSPKIPAVYAGKESTSLLLYEAMIKRFVV